MRLCPRKTTTDNTVEVLRTYLTCERKYIFILLMFTAGMMGAYTYNLRGEVFCNAQTVNFVLMAMALGKGKWSDAAYYLIPITAYIGGGFVSELLPAHINKQEMIRWETLLVGFEVIVLFTIGFIPLSMNPHVAQVMINFIASMQYNTFRQTETMPVATTFCTNHCRLVGIGIANYAKNKNTETLRKGGFSALMILVFVCGAALLTAFCALLEEKAIWMAVIPLVTVFFFLARADFTFEHDRLTETPLGH